MTKFTRTTLKASLLIAGIFVAGGLLNQLAPRAGCAAQADLGIRVNLITLTPEQIKTLSPDASSATTTVADQTPSAHSQHEPHAAPADAPEGGAFHLITPQAGDSAQEDPYMHQPGIYE